MQSAAPAAQGVPRAGLVVGNELQREVEQRFRDTNDELYESSFGAQFMSSLMQPLTMFMGNLQYVIVAVAPGVSV